MNMYSLIIPCLVPLSVYILNTASAFAQLQEKSDQDPIEASKLVAPNDTFKFLLAPLQSSNRIEYNHYHPLFVTSNSQIFIDNTTFVKQRPIATDDTNNSFISSIGNSTRVGYRNLLSKGDSFWGVNFGYDNTIQTGFYYQQLGFGIEYTSPNLQIISTFASPSGNRDYPPPGKSILSPFNIQISVPTGINSLFFLPRFYYIHNFAGASAPGGQLQLNYHFNNRLKLALSTSYDILSGSGGSLELIWRPNIPIAPNSGSLINPLILGSYSGPVGNNGTRIIRLTGSDPAFGD